MSSCPSVFRVFPNFSFLCRALDQAGHLVSFCAHLNLPYRFVSYRTLVATKNDRHISYYRTFHLLET